MDNPVLRLAHNDSEKNAKVAFSELRKDQAFSDVQLACDDECGVAVVISAHKVILAASSPFFNSVLRGIAHPKPLLYLKGIPQKQLAMLLDFIYIGEVNVMQEDLEAFLAAAIDLKVQGLTPSSPLHPPEDMGVPSADVQPLSSPAGRCPTPSIQITPDQQPSPLQSSPASISDLLSPTTSHAGGQESELLETDSGFVKTEPCDVPDEVQEESDSIPKLAEWSDLKTFVLRLANDQNGERVFSCKICHQKGTTMWALQRHVESIHFPHTFKYICNFCEKESASKQAHDGHISRMHRAEKSDEFTKAKEVKTPIKEGELNSWSDLNQYVTKLPDDKSGLKVYQCTICQFKGRKCYDLKKHVECNHFRGALKHTCNLCETDFDTKYALQYHTTTKHK